MSRLALTAGAYSARSIIANAQRAVNLFGESNSRDAPVPFTYYPAPGLRLLATPSPAGAARCLYRANTGDLYAVVGNVVYWVDSSYVYHSLGTILSRTSATELNSIVSMADNGTTAILVDGGPNGYQINLTTRALTQITEATNHPDPAFSAYAFYGSNRADVQDGYIVLGAPGTRNFYTSYLNQFIFDALYFAAKNGYSDNLVAAVVQKRQIYLIGEKTTEIWFNAGAPDFPFQIQPGPFITHGCIAKYSIATADGKVYWLSQDLNGKNILARAEGYVAKDISTKALETEWSTYATTADATAFCFQQNGHTFYQINFPTADKTWRFDDSTGQWHEAVWIDTNGVEHRHRAQVAAFAYDTNVVADWETGKLYALDPYVYTDNGAPMVWRRGFPHVLNDGNRMIYPGFVLDMEAGAASGYATQEAEYCSHPVTITAPTELTTVRELTSTPATLAAFVFSVWVNLADDSDPHGVIFTNQVDETLGSTNPGLFIEIANDETATPQITIDGWDTNGDPAVAATYDFTDWSGWVNVAISLDTATQQLQVYASRLVAGVLVEADLTPVTLTWGSLPIANPAATPWRVLTAA